MTLPGWLHAETVLTTPKGVPRDTSQAGPDTSDTNRVWLGKCHSAKSLTSSRHLVTLAANLPQTLAIFAVVSLDDR